ncbi:hypothetical protein MTO96_004416 [Rhipicephalus appendiculatus]
MKRSRSETESTPSTPSKLAGILKPRPGLFESPKAHPHKTIRFNTESEHIDTSQTIQETPVSIAESSDISDASTNSESSSSSSSNSPETGDQTQQPTTQPRPHGAAVSGAADRMLALPSWFTEHVKRYITTFTTRAERAGRDGNSSDRDQTLRVGDAGGRRPSRRRRGRSAATERYMPQSQDDMRWRVALSRYALLTVLGVATLLFLIATLHVVRGDVRSRAVEEHRAAVTLETGEDDARPRRRALKTSARDETAGPGYELNVKEADPDASLTTTEESPTTYEQPTSAGADPVVDGQRITSTRGGRKTADSD